MSDVNNNIDFPSGRRQTWKNLFMSEDYWAVWIGFILAMAGLMIYLPRPPQDMAWQLYQNNIVMEVQRQRAPFKTLLWYQANDEKYHVKATNQDFAKRIKRFTDKPHGWKTNPLRSFILTEKGARQLREQASQKYFKLVGKAVFAKKEAGFKQTRARQYQFKDEEKNLAAIKGIEAYRKLKMQISKLEKDRRVKPYNQIGYLACFGFFLGLLFALGMQVMYGNGLQFLKGFSFVFLLAVLSYLLAAQVNIRALGIGYAAWSILLGLIISNTVGTPGWVKPALQVEYFIKTGLVLLGAEILFGKIITIGIPGIFVAWVVTPIVLVSTYWFGQRILKIPSKTLNITLSADMSVCGVSAAIATAAACKAKKEELTLAIGISLIFTSIMMIVMPNIVKALGMDHVLGGAWIGGTIDATGAVAAAGAFLSDKALYVAATIKMIQNILIGVIAFFVSLYWVTKVEPESTGIKPNASEIWTRLPKFILGFVFMSIIFSVIYEALGPDTGNVMITNGVIKGWTKIFRGWFFCLAFVSIGLSTDFKSLFQYLHGGKPVLLYLCGQAFNLILTLLVAYVMFYIVFPDITANI